MTAADRGSRGGDEGGDHLRGDTFLGDFDFDFDFDLDLDLDLFAREDGDDC